jgi:hypothetical protein
MVMFGNALSGVLGWDDISIAQATEFNLTNKSQLAAPWTLRMP